MARVLYIDSDQSSVASIHSLLSGSGHEIRVASSGPEACRMAGSLLFDAAIVDERIDGGISGVDLCRELRESYPAMGIVYLLSGQENVEDRLKAYQMGADDCMVKMPPDAEFQARMAALLRRSSLRGAKKVRYGEIEIEPLDLTVTVHGSPIDLTPIQFRILKHILCNVGRIIAPSEFKQSVFKTQESIGSSKLRVHIFELRRRLGAMGNIIESVRGKGYGVGLGVSAKAA